MASLISAFPELLEYAAQSFTTVNREDKQGVIIVPSVLLVSSSSFVHVEVPSFYSSTALQNEAFTKRSC